MQRKKRVKKYFLNNYHQPKVFFSYFSFVSSFSFKFSSTQPIRVVFLEVDRFFNILLSLEIIVCFYVAQ